MTNLAADKIAFSNYPGELSSLKNIVRRGSFFEEKFILLQKEGCEGYVVYVFSVGEKQSRKARWLEGFGYKILGGGFLKFARARYVGEVSKYEAFFDSSSIKREFGFDRPENATTFVAVIAEAMERDLTH